MARQSSQTTRLSGGDISGCFYLYELPPQRLKWFVFSRPRRTTMSYGSVELEYVCRKALEAAESARAAELGKEEAEADPKRRLSSARPQGLSSGAVADGGAWEPSNAAPYFSGGAEGLGLAGGEEADVQHGDHRPWIPRLSGQGG